MRSFTASRWRPLLRYLVLPLAALCPGVVLCQVTLDHVGLVGSTKEFDIKGEIANAQISSVDPDVISFETVESAQWRHLWWIDLNEKKPHQISPRRSTDELAAESDRELRWCPVKYGGKAWYVFVSSGDESNDDVYLGNLSDNVYARLTKHRASDHHPCWSPDGRQIVFVSGRTGNGDLYLIRNMSELIREFSAAAGYPAKKTGRLPQLPQILDLTAEANLAQVTQNPDIDTFPDWSPDGRWIAYQAYFTGEGRRHCEIFMIDASNPDPAPRRLTDNSMTEKMQPRWSSDQRGVSYYSLPVTSDPSTTDVVALEYLPLTQSSSCTSPAPTRGGAFTVSNNVRRNESSGPSWCPGAALLTFIRYVGRETPLVLCRKGVQPGQSPTEDVMIPGGLSLVQYRSLDVHKIGKTARLVFISYAQQDYYLHSADLHLDGSDPKIQAVDVPIASEPASGTHVGFGGEFIVSSPTPWQRSGLTRGGGSLYIDFSHFVGCIQGFPLRYGGRWSFGNLQLAGMGPTSSMVWYTEWLFRVSTDVRFLGTSVSPFLTTGLDMVLAVEHGLAREDIESDNIFGWPFGAGVSYEASPGIEASISILHRSMTPGFLKKYTSSGDPSANFLGIHFGVTYRLHD